jgi:voltage-gated potassium channel
LSQPAAPKIAAKGHASHGLELLSAIVTLIAVGLATAIMVHDATPALSAWRPLIPWLIGLDALCCAFFWWEYFIGLRQASDRRVYLLTRSFWLLGALPLLFPLRWLRIGRVLRYLLVLRPSPGARQAWSLWVRALLSHPVDLLLIATAVVLLAGSGLLYLAERGAGGTIHTWWDALWLAATSATTDSYGDVAPVTPLGRIVSISVAFLGIVIVGSITAVITGYIVREPSGDHPETCRRLDELNARLDRIEQKLDPNDTAE